MSRIIANNIRHNDASADSLSFDSSARVGIGETSPQASLHVTGANTAARGQFVLEGASADARLTFYRDTDFIGHLSGNSDHLNISTETGHHIEFSPAGSERVRVDTDGLKFNGDTAAANALDDYEEGTWTPSLLFAGSGAGITYTAQQGNYTKIGNRVFFTCYFLLSSKGTSTGTARVHGLPFTSATGNAYTTAQVWANSINFGSTIPTGYVEPGQTRFRVERQRADGGGIYVCDQTNFNNNSDLMLMGHYFI